MRPWLLSAPALIVLVVLFGGGMAYGLALAEGPAWGTVLAEVRVRRAILLSLWIAAASTLISAVIGVAAAMLLRGVMRGRAGLAFLLQYNLTVPHLVGAIGMLYLLGQSGSLARAAHGIGLIDRPAEFPALVHDPYALAIILTFAWKEIPFVALFTLAALQGIGASYEDAARSHGASAWRAFRHVTWPLIRPAVLAASAIVFAFAFGAYEIPALLGASSPKALPVLAYERFTDPDLATRPEAMALALLTALISGSILLAGLALRRR